MKLIKKMWRLYRIRKVAGAKAANRIGAKTYKNNLYGNDDDLGFC